MLSKIFERTTNPDFWFGKDSEIIKRFISFFTAILYLDSPFTAAKIFREKFQPIRNKLPLFFNFLFLLERMSPRVLHKVLKLGIYFFAGRFIAGNGENKVLKTVRKSLKKGILVNLDILGETVLSEKEAEKYQNSYLKLIETVGPELPQRALSLSLKGSAFYSQTNPCAPEKSAEKIAGRLSPILKELQKYGGHAYLDAEEYNFRETHFLVFKKLYEKFGSTIRFVLQAYLVDSQKILMKLYDINNPADPIWVRIVRGAYWDLECYHSELLNRRSPVFLKKSDTDVNYQELICGAVWNGLKTVPATHNIPNIYFSEMYAKGILNPVPEFQVLFGIGEKISRELLKKNIPVRFYMPILFPEGNLNEATAYLLRRINESQISFIMKSSGNELEKALQELRFLPERRQYAV